MKIADLRKDYQKGGLTEAEAGEDPFRLFQEWFTAAVNAGLYEPNAMTLSTVSAAGIPSARIVLLKAFDERGFVFFTNYEGQKAVEIAAQPNVALTLYWAELERQIRIVGTASQTSRQESIDYFHSRPIGSQLGAWVSQQSREIPNREVLEAELLRVQEQYANSEIPCPDHWGGYRVVPQAIEFWQGRSSRLHDRLLYRREDGFWQRVRLAP